MVRQRMAPRRQSRGAEGGAAAWASAAWAGVYVQSTAICG